MQACEDACRANGECQSFSIELSVGIPVESVSGTCHLYKSAVGYGPLVTFTPTNFLTGQLESKATNAPLVWLGIGQFSANQIGNHLDATTLISDATCQAHCENMSALFGLPCASYRIQRVGPNWKCYGHSNAILELVDTDVNVQFGHRADLNMTKLAVVGDPWDTRVIVDDFPPAPPDIVGAIPDYIELDYHNAYGLMLIPYTVSTGVTATWRACSVKCHQDPICVSFLFYIQNWVVGSYPTKCGLFDAAIIGRMTPSSGEYGIIDRTGVEGDVLSITPSAFSEINGEWLYTFPLDGTLDDCAALCYKFHRPKLCFAFFYDFRAKNCRLYRSLPCVKNTTETAQSVYDYEVYDYADEQYHSAWDETMYRFGYLDDRLDEFTRNGFRACYDGATTTTTPTTKTTTPTTATTTTEKSTVSRQGRVQIFAKTAGKAAQGVAPRETLSGETSLQCSMTCHRRGWCVARDWNEGAKSCRLFEAAVGNDQLNKDIDSQYAVTTVDYTIPY